MRPSERYSELPLAKRNGETELMMLAMQLIEYLFENNLQGYKAEWSKTERLQRLLLNCKVEGRENYLDIVAL